MAVLLRELSISSAGALINSNVDSVRTLAHFPAAITLVERMETRKNIISNDKLYFEFIVITEIVNPKSIGRDKVIGNKKKEARPRPGFVQLEQFRLVLDI